VTDSSAAVVAEKDYGDGRRGRGEERGKGGEDGEAGGALVVDGERG
jgi:hypothetical protein